MTGAPAFGEIRHLGFVVADLEAEAHRWARELGVGPWLVSEFDLPGEEPTAHLVTAYAQWGPLQIELMEQRNAAPSCFLGHLGEGERSRLHHLCTYTETLDDDLARLQAAGYAVELSFGLRPEAEPDPSRFAIVRSPLGPGTYHELTHPGTFVRAQSDAVRDAAAGWRGERPVRPMPLALPA
jgi:hypothetical protein